MAHRPRLTLLTAIIVATLSTPLPSAAITDFMTPVPPGTLLEVLVPDQGVPDAACVTRCGVQRDRAVADASRMLAGREYFSMFDSNCWTLDNGPNCAAVRQTCREACGPKFESACVAACEPPFQNCCAANDKTRAARNYDACVVKCPAAKAPVPPPPPQSPPPDKPAQSGSADRKAEWSLLLNAMNATLTTIGSKIGGLELERFNDLRRMLAFAQVSAGLAEHNGRYAMVSGGQGRIWFIRPDGRQTLLDAKAAAALRRPTYSLAEVEAQHKEAIAGMLAAGLTENEAIEVLNNIAFHDTGALTDKKFHTGGFKPGDVWYFPKGSNWSKEAATNQTLASSEHGSIRGTINGGGDFI